MWKKIGKIKTFIRWKLFKINKRQGKSETKYGDSIMDLGPDGSLIQVKHKLHKKGNKWVQGERRGDIRKV
ncbi:MAG: hypothetical protein ABH854_00310 [Candidatus Diapherotrites archaeon]|nr:hypothetical protein [Candidatus Micrarchaeota archaeon]MBU1939994.1 hypothetical protein [Candidatus Micrarchaeota archaeon]